MNENVNPSKITTGQELSPFVAKRFIEGKTAQEVSAALEVLRLDVYGFPFFPKGYDTANVIEQEARRAGIL